MAPQVEELSIRAVHDAYRRRLFTAEDLVWAYLQRIEAVDRAGAGPQLNALLALDADAALAEARRQDAALGGTGDLVGPLHGVPVVVKDSIQTAGLATCFGSVAARDHVPREDASVVARLRAAGAIVLAKAALPDFGTDFFSLSSLSGTVRNPYALDRDPGASSSGTAAAVAANLALAGLGSDSAGSIRLPASFCNLVGLRPTPGLVSGAGCLVGVKGQSSQGPLCRTVTDAALMLDCMAGFDEADDRTAVHAVFLGPQGDSFASELGKLELSSFKVGVVGAFFGSEENEAQAAVNSVVHEALGKLKDAGTKTADVEIPGLKNYLESTSLFLSRSRADLDSFLKPTLGLTLLDVFKSKKYPEGNVMIPYICATGADSPYTFDGYAKQVDTREDFQLAVASVMLKHGVSALVFPTAKETAPRTADIDMKTRAYFPTNTSLASQLRWPAISVPVGFTAEGLPVGVDLVGPPFSDQKLLNLAYAIEQVVQARKSPSL